MPRHLQPEAAGHARQAARHAQQLHAAHAQLAQDLRAHAVAAQIHASALGRMAGARLALELRQQLIGAFAAIEQHGHAAPGLGDEGQARIHAPGVHGAARLQRVQHRKRLVHAHGHFFIGLPLAFGQRQMQRAAGRIAPQLRHELAMCRHHGARGHAAHQRFIAAAVLNQIGNRADLQPVLRGEKLQIGQPRHRAVGIHDFANNGSGRAAGHARQIAPGLGVPGAHQHAALHGLNGKHVPRLHQVLRPGLPRHRRFDGARAVGG